MALALMQEIYTLRRLCILVTEIPYNAQGVSLYLVLVHYGDHVRVEQHWQRPFPGHHNQNAIVILLKHGPATIHTMSGEKLLFDVMYRHV